MKTHEIESPPGAPVCHYDFVDVVDAMSAKLYLLERTSVCMIHNTVQIAVRTTIPKPALHLLNRGEFGRERWIETTEITLHMCPICNGLSANKWHKLGCGRDRTGLVVGQYRALFQ